MKKEEKIEAMNILNDNQYASIIEQIDLDREILDLKQKTAEWYEARLRRITGSDISALFGTVAARTKYIYKKAAETLTNRRCDSDISSFSNIHINRGNEYENEAREMYEQIKQIKVKEVGFVTIKNNIIGCSPDGFAGDEGMIEIKCPDINNFVENVCEIESKACSSRFGIKDEYYMQMQFNMLVSGKKWCDFIIYSPYFEYETQRFYVQRVESSETDKRMILSVVEKAKKDIADVISNFVVIQYQKKANNA